jgi:crotonobetainyl-CoA hydratase
MTRAEPVERPILTETVEDVRVITLNRPHALNAIDAALSDALGHALADAQADPRVRAVVVTGAGRAFCAGMDLKAFARGEQGYVPDHPEWGFAGMARQLLTMPVIAAVNGPAIGGGCELVLACDLAVASTEAIFGLPEVSRGLVAGGGGVFRLARVIGRRRATEMILTGAPITATTALDYGLVNRVVDAAALLPAARELADAIAANAPLAVQVSKSLLRDSDRFGSDWDGDIWRLNEAATESVVASADSLEGARAFAEKRPPVWTGR